MSQKPAVDKVSSIIFSRFSISVLVVLIPSKNNFMIVPFFDFGFLRYRKIVKSWKLERLIVKWYKVSRPNAELSANKTDFIQ